MGPGDPGPPPALTCQVVSQRQGAFLRLNGEIRSAAPTSGTYRLEITKAGPSGTSRVAQSGQFTTSADEPVRAGETGLDFGPRTRIEALLTVTYSGHTTTCRKQESSDD